METIEETYEYLVTKLNKDIANGCIKYKGSITSGLRTVQRNRNVGGHPKSWHLDDLARDIIIDDLDNYNSLSKYLINLGYCIICHDDTLMLHIQYNFPIEHNFERTGHYSHLMHILIKDPKIKENIQKEIIKERTKNGKKNQNIGA